MRAKALEPVTLVRSPMFTKRISAVTLKGSKPESFIGGITFAVLLMLTAPHSHDRRVVAYAVQLH